MLLQIIRNDITKMKADGLPCKYVIHAVGPLLA